MAQMHVNANIQSVLFDREQIAQTVQRLGSEISRDYNGKNLLLVSVLKGSVVFLADLMRAITIPCRIEFMGVSSYGLRTASSGAVQLYKKLSIPPGGLDVLLVEDILDSGNTLHAVVQLLEAEKPRSIEICTLLNKPARRQTNEQVRYCGSVIPDVFVVGYGLDYDEQYRNLPYIGILRPELYAE